TGNRFLRIYSRVEDSWKVFCDEKIKPDQFSVGDINNDGCPELVLSGKSGIRVYNFRDLPFSPITSHELITEVVKPADLIGRPAPALQVDHWYNGEPTSL